MIKPSLISEFHGNQKLLNERNKSTKFVRVYSIKMLNWMCLSQSQEELQLLFAFAIIATSNVNINYLQILSQQPIRGRSFSRRCCRATIDLVQF